MSADEQQQKRRAIQNSELFSFLDFTLISLSPLSPTTNPTWTPTSSSTRPGLQNSNGAEIKLGFFLTENEKVLIYTLHAPTLLQTTGITSTTTTTTLINMHRLK
jgi:hypothetical protein